MTQAHLDAITPSDLSGFHERYWRPENMLFAISGDVDTQEILGKIVITP